MQTAQRLGFASNNQTKRWFGIPQNTNISDPSSSLKSNMKTGYSIRSQRGMFPQLGMIFQFLNFNWGGLLKVVGHIRNKDDILNDGA